MEEIIIPTAHFKGRWGHLRQIIIDPGGAEGWVQIGDNPEARRFFSSDGNNAVTGNPAALKWLNEVADRLAK